jgi:hypothetical protein
MKIENQVIKEIHAKPEKQEKDNYIFTFDAQTIYIIPKVINFSHNNSIYLKVYYTHYPISLLTTSFYLCLYASHGFESFKKKAGKDEDRRTEKKEKSYQTDRNLER